MSIPKLTMLQGDCLKVLRTLPADSVHCCITSPPYWGLRDYGVEGQLGLEKTPDEYVAKMVSVFREVRRVLREDGTLWLNIGDSYVANGGPGERGMIERGTPSPNALSKAQHLCDKKPSKNCGLAAKNMIGIPWRLAFALQADGWWLRQDIIWAKPNPMPESVTDRCTKSHEYLFLLTKSERYFYDSEAVKERGVESRPWGSRDNVGQFDGAGYGNKSGNLGVAAIDNGGTRNKRSVWTIATEPYSEAHFATFPTALVKPCILAGTSERGCCPHCGAPWERVVERSGGSIGHSWHDHSCDLEHGQRVTDPTAKGRIGRCKDGNGEEYQVKTTGWQPTCDCGYGNLKPCTVLDPFGGSGTTGQVALEYGRNAILIELNPEYVNLINRRTSVTPGLNLA